MSNIIIRNEKPSDFNQTEIITREAFFNHYSPACDEHYLLHIMRTHSDFISELDFVAELDGKVVGSIIYTKAKVVTDDNQQMDVLVIGPLSVSPKHQGKGIGGSLIKYSARVAKDMGYKAVFLYGDPLYYSRFGFQPAEKHMIGSADNMYADALQVLKLQDGALDNISGRLIDSDVFKFVPQVAKEFDKHFLPKELVENTPSQQRFQELIKKVKPRS